MLRIRIVSMIASFLAMGHTSCYGFSFIEMERKRRTSQSLRLSWSTDTVGDNNRADDDSGTGRRTFLSQAAASAGFTVLSGGSNALLLTTPSPANAVTGLEKVNARLQGYGLPAASSPLPSGFTTLCEIYGKGKNRFPLLVSFAYPLTWVVTLPSNDVNGEDGTIQAGDYAKGDTATLFVYDNDGRHVDDVTTQPKELFEKALIKAISQKGDNMYQNFKITKMSPGTGSYMKDQKYMLVDFKYQLLTGAGFEVDRKGVASVTSEGKAVEVMWAASTTTRYKKTENQLRDIVSSFRCYADGLNLSEELFEA